MKRIECISLIFMIIGELYSQDTIWVCDNFNHPIPGKNCSHCFDNDFYDTNNYLFISNSENQIWQIGSTNKFENLPINTRRGIITDTLDSYPMNNYSVFSITIIGAFGSYPFTLDFNHVFDTEKGKDGGKIEIFDKTENQWINIINYSSTILNPFGLYGPDDTVEALNNEPGFTGLSSEYNSCGIYIEPRSYIDTFDLRFVFASDSIDDNKAGWLIYNLRLCAVYEDIEDFEGSSIIVFPNPFNTTIKIKNIEPGNGENNLEIYDCIGSLIYNQSNYQNEDIILDNISPGIYFLKIMNDNRVFLKKIVKK